ncbi:alanine--tRNA ligase, partial [bacterium]|nr:alanine--tRNA ligase [bacterium]
MLTKVYELPPERLVFTVYQNDDEAFNIWTQDIGISPKRVARMGPKTNFWQMADTGPCGPTTEIHWDKTPDLGEDSIVPLLQAEDERFLEIWNLVFMQFNRTQADPDHTGQYDTPLPTPGVDTGMGLERIVSIVQGVKANYETDLFMPIIRAVQTLTGHTDAERDTNIVPYRVIADHTRAAVFLIADGVNPGAKGRDSVCRLVIRRAVRFGTKLGFNAPFLAPIAQAVIDVMSSHYTELVEKAERIKHIISQEEERFFRTLERGLSELDEMLTALPAGGTLAGDKAFYLKSTLGLPIQVTKDIAEERGYTLDMTSYESAEEQHSLISGGGQAMGHMGSAEAYKALLAQLQAEGELPSEGVLYNPYDPRPIESRVVALLQNGQPVQSAIVGDKVEVVLAATPFYVESGGQVSDTGTISGAGWVIEVEDMKKAAPGLIVHEGEVVEGTPRSGETATAALDMQRRHDILRNHTGTHLLHAALRKHLGTHVEQRGSLVAPERLRFDFSHTDKMSGDELARIQADVNAAILHNYGVQTQVKSLEQAKSEG